MTFTFFHHVSYNSPFSPHLLQEPCRRENPIYPNTVATQERSQQPALRLSLIQSPILRPDPNPGQADNWRDHLPDPEEGSSSRGGGGLRVRASSRASSRSASRITQQPPDPVVGSSSRGGAGVRASSRIASRISRQAGEHQGQM